MSVWVFDQKKRARFPKRSRLSRRDSFSTLLKQRAQYNQWFAIYTMPNQSGCARLGVTVGKRLIPKAVHRNRIKRLIRECFRAIDRQGIEKDVVVRLRRGLEKKDYAGAASALTETLRIVLCIK